MANRTDPLAIHAHGFDPQFLIDKITREKIYQCAYWKAECFGLTAETLVDKAAQLTYVGGLYGPLKKPTPFLCLILKLLQLSPDKEIVYKYLRQKKFKYLTALAAFYWRLVGNGVEVYRELEPLYEDFRKLRVRRENKYELIHMDELMEELLLKEDVCDIKLPRLPNRNVLMEEKLLGPRKSKLEQELEEELRESGALILEETSKQDKEQWEKNNEQQQQQQTATAQSKVYHKLRFRDLLVQASNRTKGRKLMEQVQHQPDENTEQDNSLAEWNRLRKELGLQPLK
ncbi:hypothetical protein GAYE_SCF59G6467 [Galdieria yellowstonensis]|uniref:Pre-mRNA-splicing factor 38 n=1 Tax=Galdieria yellowstonensis TaxID=3028027 RepID=A0AAV9IMK7_9RHOD|nr:hypothetical protein GAYE_SCF59G6467 [Galdieria yellowstonensis]